MAFTNSSLVNYIKISPNRTVGRKHAIDTITIHCVVGQASVETLGNIFGRPARQASSNYGIGFDGRIGMYCEEKDRSWCSSSPSNDHRAITIEVASDTTYPYAVNAKAYASLINLVADICKRNGIKELKWKADKSLIGQVDKQNMTVHRWFAATACPGEYLYSRMGQIAQEVNKKLGIGTTTTNQMYRIRKTWKDAASQIGAYTNFDNAKRACKDGYYVFDSKGNIIYPEQKQEAAPAPAPTKKSVQEIAAEVWAGKWGNGAIRKQRLEAAGYNYNEVQRAVEAYKKTPTPAPVKKSNEKIAAEVLAGKWGNGQDRKNRLTAAGYDYATIQNIVNGKKPSPAPAPTKKSNAEIAKEVWAGKWGNGTDRRKRLEAAGYNYAAVQAEVEKIIKGGKATSNGYRVQITAGALNVRAGAGTGYRIVKVVHKGEIYTIVQTSGGWGKLSDGSGWISLAYTRKV